MIPIGQAEIDNNTYAAMSSSSVYVLTENVIIGPSFAGFTPADATVVVDGSGHRITVSGVSAFVGLFLRAATVQNLHVDSSGSALATSCGWIFTNDVSGGTAISCSSTGDITSQNSGGIFGYGNSGDASGCWSTGAISGDSAGGIFGAYAGNSTAMGCWSTGTGTGSNAGGIFGSYAGANTHTAVATTCWFTGEIGGQSAGGIFGSYAGSGGIAHATGCWSTGMMTGGYNGGIFGGYCGSYGGNATATYCRSTGDMTNINSGGIMGIYAGGLSGSCTATSCYSTGMIGATNGGGIIGTYPGGVYGHLTVVNCYSTGTITVAEAGGILGYAAAYYYGAASITNSYSISHVTDTTGTVGGLMGPVAGSVSVTNCLYVGNATKITVGGETLVTTTNTGIDKTWTDAKAHIYLTGIGSSWYRILPGVPYILPWQALVLPGPGTGRLTFTLHCP